MSDARVWGLGVHVKFSILVEQNARPDQDGVRARVGALAFLAAWLPHRVPACLRAAVLVGLPAPLRACVPSLMYA